RDRLDLFAASRWVLIGYIGLLPGLEADLADAVRLIATTGCKVAIETAGDGGRLEQVAPALPHVDLYVPSLDEARAQTGRDDPRAIIEHYRSLGARGLIGVKLGTAGTLLSPAVKEWLEVPCLAAPGPVVDTTGCGDAFHGAYAMALALGRDFAARLTFATAAAAVLASRLTGEPRTPTSDEVEALVASRPPL
ncbi:MAG: carbohydrate kinase family protein, partial [Actinobacteria bacterium]|nr:carbohydrate kinase family protein [Actinomycetota bacterium]